MQYGLQVASSISMCCQVAGEVCTGAGQCPMRGNSRALRLAPAERPPAARIADAAFWACRLSSLMCRGTVRAIGTTHAHGLGHYRCVRAEMRRCMCRVLCGCIVQADAERASIAPRDRSASGMPRRRETCKIRACTVAPKSV